MSKELIESKENQEELIAHLHQREDGSWDPPHQLLDHLLGTGALASRFAESFGSGAWGEIIGLLHDLGKSRVEWQNYLKEKSGFYDDDQLEGRSGTIPHAIYGAKHALRLYHDAGRFLAYSIAGHHTGLPDWSSADGGFASLKFQLNKNLSLDDLNGELLRRLNLPKLNSPPWVFDTKLDLSLWIRMLYSCLVDADFLDTESYMDHSRSVSRGGRTSLPELLELYNNYMLAFESGKGETPVNLVRKDVRKACISAASNEPGMFSLTVPTGGGKTLSSLGFALKHAVLHNMRQIIYVIPYTSIIEQNADVFRSVLGKENVVEHHSNIAEDDLNIRTKLSCENWDAPLIVTTSVQFFESLFASRPGRSRKLHNIVNSVVILDEAQLLPADFLEPILKAIDLLVKHYRVTFVLSTATQPAFMEHNLAGRKFPGFQKITEIMGNKVPEIFAKLDRVSIHFPEDPHLAKTWDKLAEELVNYRQVLCIVSDRKSCRELYSNMPKGTFHLSALMCGAHRSKKIKEIKEKLGNGEPVRVISTQLVEAGVDIDFPVVYRSMAGLDSIAQAAGRCNREGKRGEVGRVVVFNSQRQPPAGILRKAENVTRNLVDDIKERPLDPEAFTRFFSELYWKINNLDSHGIIKLLSPDAVEAGMAFRSASNSFRLIDDSIQKTILVKYGEGEKLIEKLKHDGMEKTLRRKLQRYAVNVYNREFDWLMEMGLLDEVDRDTYALNSPLNYDEDIGVIIKEVLYDPEKYILQ